MASIVFQVNQLLLLTTVILNNRLHVLIELFIPLVKFLSRSTPFMLHVNTFNTNKVGD